jgi:hypothetical protein
VCRLPGPQPQNPTGNAFNSWSERRTGTRLDDAESWTGNAMVKRIVVLMLI